MIKAGLFVILAGLTILFTSCAAPATTAVFTPRHSDMNFIFKYGIGAKNILDTFQNKFTKDLIQAPSVTTALYLTDEDMERIYQKMVEINFFSYPDEFAVNVPAGGLATVLTPYASYYFTVEKGRPNQDIALG